MYNQRKKQIEEFKNIIEKMQKENKEQNNIIDKLINNLSNNEYNLSKKDSPNECRL